LISRSVTPGAFWAVAGIAIAPLRSKQPDKIRNTPLRASGGPGSGYPVTGLGGFCARAPSGHTAAPPKNAMKSRRFN
jgi:hypothetical protein